MPEQEDKKLNQSSVPNEAPTEEGATEAVQKEPSVMVDDPVTVVVGDSDQAKGGGAPKEPAGKPDPGQVDEATSKDVDATSDETSPHVDAQEKKGEQAGENENKKSQGKGKEEKKKKKKEKPKRAPRRHVSIREIPALLFPEHLGDIFVIAMIFALAIGAGVFWFFAWIPTNESPPQRAQENIQQFSDTELQDIITILENREEASKAPVIAPNRDPFF